MSVKLQIECLMHWKHPSIAAVEFEKKSEPPIDLGDGRVSLCPARLTERHPCELSQGHEGGHQTTHNDRRIVFYYSQHDEQTVKAILANVPKSAPFRDNEACVCAAPSPQLQTTGRWSGAMVCRNCRLLTKSTPPPPKR